MTDLQRTDEWHGHRLGKATASRMDCVLAKPGTAARENYKVDLAVERITGVPSSSFVSPAMAMGTEREPRARAVFEFVEGVRVEQVGFVDHPTIPMSGASPDGLVSDNGLLEIKCPQKATHWGYLKGNELPTKYKPQTQWQLACTGKQIIHFVSFQPDFPEELMYAHFWSPRDDEYIAMLEKEVTKFLSEVDAEVDRMQKMIRAQHLLKGNAA